MRELCTEIGADMSGRRRRDDGWGDGRPDAQDDRRDPWADDGIGDWGGRDADPGEDTERPAKSSGGAAGAYVRNAPPGGKAYAPPDFPSFEAGGGRGGQHGAPNGHAQAGYDEYQDAGYGTGRDGYQGSGYGRNGSSGSNGSSGNGGGRREAAGYDAAYGSVDSAVGGYGRQGNGSAGRGNDSGYGGGPGYASANGRSASPSNAPEFTPVDNDEVEDEGPVGTPRPYGRLSIYTLHDDQTREFDRLAERAAEGVRTAEPDTLVYVIHVVPKAPMQRIIYEIYRDRAAFLSHERQPHIRQFAAERAPCVLATNIIDLRLKYAKVAALGAQPESTAQGQAQQPQQPQPQQPQQQASWNPRGAEAAQGSDRYSAAATQYAPTQYSAAQYSAAQYSEAPPQGATAAASFTPAKDRYASDNSQYPTVGREAYSPAPQYGNSGNGAYGAGASQYGAANSNGYSGAAGYTNGGSYSSNGYPGSNGYQGANGYSGDNSYSGANGYQSANGYSGANGYSNGNGYSGSSGYSNGSGYAGSNGYSSGSGYSGGAANGGGNGYGAAGGYDVNGAGSYGAAASAQYTPRYRELTSGSQPEASAGGYQANDGNHYQEEDQQSARPQSAEWDPRPQDYR
jgi:quinol monooxygenase YgiN